jgi:hypothetical protein
MLHSAKIFPAIPIIFIALLLGSCKPGITTPKPSTSPTVNAPETFVVSALTQISGTQTAAPTPVPETYNPLTGLHVADPALLQLPALLVSISHFPVDARPQAGLSFAPYVFEIYITEGATRFLTTFYGKFPAPEVPIVGNCEVRRERFTQTGLIVGNRVWHDENQNSLQEDWENGIGGVCVNLYDATGTLVQQTTTDSNGYYGFNIEAGNYTLEFLKPPDMEFAQRDAGEDAKDSDVDPATGRTEPRDIHASLLDLDAGLILLRMPPPTSALPLAKVGPVRSGRMVYRHIAAFFPDSCLIYAFASAEVLEHLPKCAFVDHDVQGGGYMLEISEMIRLAQESKKPEQKIDYSSNIYSVEAPEGGVDASQLHVYIAWLNQSAWNYDPLYQSWWRYVDYADQGTPGDVHAEVERLTGRQLHFENVIVLFAKHEVISPTNLEIRMEQDWLGDALLFRDGKMYKIRWSTVATDEEFQSGRRKPIRFLNLDDQTPFPLKPGKTWILVVTPETTVAEKAAGEWLLQFVQPEGAK